MNKRHDHHDAEDLVQHALIKLYERWPRVSKQGSPDGYVRATMANRLVDTKRSAFARHEERRQDLPDSVSEADLLGDLVVDSQTVRPLLLKLPPVERAAVVLRYFGDLAVPDVADSLGLSVSQTKRHIRHGLDRMRALGTESV